MRPRKRISPVEMLIIMAIVGIFTSIALPALKQTSRRPHPPRPPRQVAQPLAPDGQLNTVELSPESVDARRSTPPDWGRTIGSLLPLAFAVAIAVIIVTAFRRQISRHTNS